MSEIEVKALEWSAEANGEYVAVSVIGWFHIGRPASYWNLTTPHGLVSSYETLDAAKAAAQSDYEARIRSALVERKAEPVCYVSQKSLDQLDADGSHVAVSTLIHKRPLRSGNGVALYSTPPAAPVRGEESATEQQLRELFGMEPEDGPLEDVIATHDGEWRKAGRVWHWHAGEELAVPYRVEIVQPLSASPSPVDSRDGLIERLVTPHSYAQEYEFRGDGGDYVPTDAERTMIEDAICGYLGELAEAHLALSAAKEQQP